MGFDTLRQLLKVQKDGIGMDAPEKPVVMIIDDDRHLLDDLSFTLRDDYGVVCCEGGKDGLEKLDETVSAVVLDIKMPDQDGFQVFKAIKEHYLNLPVLFHSAYQDLKDPYDIMNEYRPFGYVSKSANLSQLQDSIASAVEYYAQIRKNQQLVKDLQLTRNYLDNIINSMPSVLVGLDPEKNVIHWNRKAEEATGIKAGDAIGKPFETVFPQMVDQMKRLCKTMKGKEPQKAEKLAKEEDGRTRYSDMLLYPLINNGLEGLVLRIDDVTERVMLEEMMVKAEKMMTISGLSAGIAHEINNPLTIILQSIEMADLQLSPDYPKNTETARSMGVDLPKVRDYMNHQNIFKYFDDIKRASLRTSEIAENMLRFSRKCESKHKPADIHQLIEEVIDLAANEYSMKKNFNFRSIEIVRNYTGGIPEVPCVRVEIGQVLLNLLRNAAQAMAANPPEKKPQITIETAMDNGKAMIVVSDNGPGMSGETLTHIFEPFFTTKGEGQGTGLGLSVSSHIIKDHHKGELKVESTPGMGTVFRILLPLQTGDAMK